jgi:hypothetical protein
MKIILDNPYRSFFYWGICHLIEYAAQVQAPEHRQMAAKYIRDAVNEVKGKKARAEISVIVGEKFKQEKLNRKKWGLDK